MASDYSFKDNVSQKKFTLATDRSDEILIAEVTDSGIVFSIENEVTHESRSFKFETSEFLPSNSDDSDWTRKWLSDFGHWILKACDY